MDPVSLTLGILPLVGAAVKGYGTITEKIKICRHFDREIRRVRASFESQKSIFLNEVQLLLRPAAKNNSTVDQMLKNSRHAKWTCTTTDSLLQNVLGANSKSCVGTIETIVTEVEELEDSLQSLTKYIEKRKKVSLLP